MKGCDDMKITKNMIKQGFDKGIIKIIDSPNDDGAVCEIGNGIVSNWFYFGGFTAEEETAESYVKNVPFDDIVNEVYDTLDAFATDGVVELEEEYEFYKAILIENGCK